MKNSKLNEYKAVLPTSYQHLQKLAMKGKKLKCDSNKCYSHVSMVYSGVGLFICLSIIASALFLILGVAFDRGNLPYFRALYFGVAGLLAVGSFGLSLVHRWLEQRDWLVAHADKVIKEFIPDYLIEQTYSMHNSLLAGDSPFRSAVCKVVDVENQARHIRDICEQFCLVEGGVIQLPSHLSEQLAQAKVCLGFAEMRHLLETSRSLVMGYLDMKRQRVMYFQKSVNENMKTAAAMALMQEAWLGEARAVLRDMETLKKVFDKNFAEVPVEWVTSTASVTHVQITAQKATPLFVGLYDFYGDIPVSATVNEPIEPDESQAGEPPTTAGKGLTEAELAELERLEKVE